MEQDTGPTVTDQNTALSHQDAPRDGATSMTLNDGVSTTEWTGFKIVGNNIDKSFWPTYQCHDMPFTCMQ